MKDVRVPCIHCTFIHACYHILPSRSLPRYDTRYITILMTKGERSTRMDQYVATVNAKQCKLAPAPDSMQ